MSHNAQMKGVYKPGVSCLEVEATDFIYEQLTKSAKGVDIFKAFVCKQLATQVGKLRQTPPKQMWLKSIRKVCQKAACFKVVALSAGMTPT